MMGLTFVAYHYDLVWDGVVYRIRITDRIGGLAEGSTLATVWEMFLRVVMERKDELAICARRVKVVLDI